MEQKFVIIPAANNQHNIVNLKYLVYVELMSGGKTAKIHLINYAFETKYSFAEVKKIVGIEL